MIIAQKVLMGEHFSQTGAEMAQPGKARAWKARGGLRLGSSNLPLGAIFLHYF